MKNTHRRWRTIAMTFLAALFIAGVADMASAAGGDILWQLTDNQAGKQEATAAAPDDQGNLIVTGFQDLTGSGDDEFWTVKFTRDGTIAWQVPFAGQSGKSQAIVVDSNRDSIVTGHVWNGTNWDIQTVKYSRATGAMLWQHTFDGAAHGNDIGTSVVVDSLNNVYVGGNSQNAAGKDTYVVIKYAPSGPDQFGNPLWRTYWNGTANGPDQLASLAVSSSGVIATGASWNGTVFKYATVKFDGSGTKVWEQPYGSPAARDAWGKYVRTDGTGNVVVTGFSNNALDKDIYTAKYNGNTGAILWERTYNGAYDDEPNGLVLDQAGDAYLTGSTWTLAGNNNFYTARYSGSNGSVVWQSTFDSGNGSDDVTAATGIAVDEGGDVFVTGYSVNNGNYDLQTIKYRRSTGTQLWQHRFNSLANLNERPVGIGVALTGEVLVGGWTDSGVTGIDLMVIKYDPGLLNPPTGLAATTLSKTSIQLTWIDNATNEEGFAIERKLGENGTYTQIATVGANITTYTDSNLTENNAYYYRVRSYNAAAGTSHYSNEVHALTVYINQLPLAWSYIYNSPDNQDDFANAIAVGPDGNPVVTGYSLRTTGGFDYFTARLNRISGGELWSQLYDDPDSELDVAKCVTVDSTNNAIVSGYASLFFPAAAQNINSIFTLKYPPTGLPALWTAQYNGPGAIDDRATAIATTTDAANNVVVTGYGKNGSGNEDIYLVKYAADGTKAWAIIPFDGVGHGDDIPSAVAFAPDGSVYVTGYSERGPLVGSYYLFTAKYNGSTGALIWSDVYSPQAGGNNRGTAIAVDAAGDPYVTGTATNGAGNQDIYLVKYSGSSASAQRLWERYIDGAAHGDDTGIGVVIDAIDGTVAVAGTTLTTPGDHDFTLARYTATGDQIWQRTLQRHDLDDVAVALAGDASGYLYLAGNTDSGTGPDLLAVLYDYEGTFLGATTYAGGVGGLDEVSGIAVNSRGEAFIAGYTTNASANADYLVFRQTNPYLLAPAPFSATPQVDFSKIVLSWGNNSAGSTFRVERTLGPVTVDSIWTLLATPLAGSTSFQDSGLNPGTSYCYRISAESGSLMSRKLTACATTTLPPPAMNPLTILSSTAIDLSWTNVPGNTGYKVERQVAAGAWAQIGGTLAANTTIYHDTGLTAGTVYSYRVSTLNSAGISLTSSVLVAPVLNALAGITSAKIDLTWPTVPGVTGYKLERSPDSISWSQIAAPLAAATSYSDTSVTSGILYYYRLKAVTAAGDSVPSLVRSAMTKEKTPELYYAASPSPSQITVNWYDLNNNETGYTLEYAACISSYDNPNSCTANISYDPAWGAWTPIPLPANSTTATINSLTAGRTYRLRVTATLAGANSDPSALVTATTNLVAPTNLLATAATASSVTLTWSDVLGELNYRVLKDGVVLTGTGLPLGQNVATYTVTGLSLSTPYCFKVQPYNATSSADSNQSCVTLNGPPTLNTVTANSSTQISLAWTDVPGATGFEVWQSGASNQYLQPATPETGSWNAYANLTPTPLVAGTTSHVISTGLNAGWAYKYKIRYKLADGSFSPFSNELMATTVPPLPTHYISAVAATQVTFNWYDGYGETSYNVQVKPLVAALCSAEDWTGIVSSAVGQNTTSYNAIALNPGTVYCLRVNAANAAGPSAWTLPLVATTLLPAPTLSPLTGVTQSQITLTWNNVTGNTGYKVERSTDGGNWTQANLPATNVVTFTDTNLAPNQLYYYRVSTKNSANAYSTPSTAQSATTLAVTPPVLNPLSGITTSQIVLSWADVPGNVGYKVERSLDGGTWSQIALPVQGAITYTSTGLDAGTLYYYRIFTRNSLGFYSVASSPQSATTTPAMPAAFALGIVSEAEIDLSWRLSKGATQYRVEQKVGAGSWGTLTTLAIPYAELYCGTDPAPSINCPTLSARSTLYQNTGLTQNETYCYRVAAWNGTGSYSAISAELCSKTPAVDGPTLTVVTPLDSRRIKLDWSYSPAACSPVPCLNPDGFEVEVQTVNGQWAQVARTANVTTHTDTLNIEPQQAYRYRVRAYRGSDVSSYSNELATVTPSYAAQHGTCP